MPIELNSERGRARIAWLGSRPPEDALIAFRERGYLIEETPCTPSDLRRADFLASISAVVFEQRRDKLHEIANNLEKHAQRLMAYGCLVILRWSAPNEMVPVANAVNRIGLPLTGLDPPGIDVKRRRVPIDRDEPAPYARIFNQNASWIEIANFVSEVGPRYAPNLALKIKVDDGLAQAEVRNGDATDDESELLIRRAFHEQGCTHILLVPMEGGKSGGRAYVAYATMGGADGPWQQPRFVKIGPREKILVEYENYELYVEPYVPFHLGPHLDRDRCCLGARQGIIVGDYVGLSETLYECACSGRSGSAIACLFDVTLSAWHCQATEVSVSIAAGLLKRVPRARKFPPKRLDAARALGSVLNPDQLRELFMRCTVTPVLAGRIHGDLHAANVLVRGADAIVIDFYAHPREPYPLLYDAACLEASLLVMGFTRDPRGWDANEWLQSLCPLYDGAPLSERVMRSGPKNSSFWFHACVLQIRRYARQWECATGQYAGALALALLEKASKDWDVTGPEGDRRAAAYLFAERVLTASFGPLTQAANAAVNS